jgi:hypothetical protein
MNYEDLLNAGETLSRVARFEVARKQGRILIDLHQVLAGLADARYIAMPYLTFVGHSKVKYYGYGDSEEAALRDCLQKIKGASYHDVTGADHIDELE